MQTRDAATFSIHNSPAILLDDYDRPFIAADAVLMWVRLPSLVPNPSHRPVFSTVTDQQLDVGRPGNETAVFRFLTCHVYENGLEGTSLGLPLK